MNINEFKYVVVGSGFYGSVVAERIANVLNENVLVIEKRAHIGGNSYSETDSDTKIEYHKYGTHIFHTSNEKVWEYINQFTEFNNYYHQVLTTYKNLVYQMPINLETINSFYNINLRPYEVDDFLEKEIKNEYYSEPKNFEERGVNLVGRPLYDAFLKGYTEKQWGCSATEIPASILKRLPFRKNYRENYYFDKWQGIPLDGYGKLFERMLYNSKIEILLNTDFFEVKDHFLEKQHIIYTGPIDLFFGYKYGKLGWRSLRFEFEIIPVEDYQGTSVMNYAESEVPYTRIHEPRHIHPEREYTKEKTLIIKEYPLGSKDNEPYYSINDKENQKIFKKYCELGKKLCNVSFGGRLGEYKYYDMHHTIDRALKYFENKLNI